MNSFGRLFKLSIFGESHGKSIGITIDGCPAGLDLNLSDFDTDLLRRKSGAKGTTQRIENDTPQIISGVYNHKTTGAPITILFENKNIQSSDYNFKSVPRPGHADFTAIKKFGGFADLRGGGHFSGRLTLGLVAAGVIAKKIISPIDIKAQVIEIAGAGKFEEIVNKAIEQNDSVGGLIECKSTNIPIGLGEPFFDSIESLISHVIFAIPAIKGIEFGSGFASAKMLGSEHNDIFIDNNGKTATNNAGGINGGITNGNDFVFKVAIKPTSSIGIKQRTLNFETNQFEQLEIKGRHDVCIALRMPSIIEAAVAIVFADLLLINKNYSKC